MFQKQEEMNGCALNGDKVEAFTVSPQEKGRKNKRKLADPSQQTATSLIEFPPYESSPSLKPQTHSSGNQSVGEVYRVGSVEWDDDPFACHLESLLSSNLFMVFMNAITKLIDCGYTDEDVLKAMSASELCRGGNDLESNIVNNTLSVLKNGNEGVCSRDYVFENLQQLVMYALVEMISFVKEVRPSLSTVEAMWRLLMCDLYVLEAIEVEGDGLVSSCKSSDSESLSVEGNPPNFNDPDPPQSNAQSNRSEPLKFGNFPNIPNSKKTQSKGTPSGKEVSSGRCECMRSASFTLVSDERLVSCRKGHTKKVKAVIRQKSCMDKMRTHSKCSGYKAAKFASVGSFLLEKRVKSSSEFVARNTSSKITAEIGVKVSVAEDKGCFVKKSSKVDSSVLLVDAKGYITAVPATSTTSVKSASKEKSGSESATLIPSASEKKSESLVPSYSEKKSCSLVPSASEKKSGSDREEKAPVSAKPAPDYYAGIPYDASLGIHVPSDEKDELILKLVPQVNDLQNELQVWTDWAYQKVKEATGRLLKAQPELKTLRKEREEAEKHRQEKQILEENAKKKLSEMDSLLKSVTSELEKARSAAPRLKLEHSLLKKEMEAAKIKAIESAESCREAKERRRRSLKDTHSWEREKALLQEDLNVQRDKVTVLQREITKAKNRQHQIEATLKQERTAKEELTVQASLIKKETNELEALGKLEEARIKAKAEADVSYYTENIKRLERELSKLKLKSDYSRIMALKKGIISEDVGGMRKVKRERECVMCLSEEMSVIFLPCAHQVLCCKCNEIHQNRGVMECPSCRGVIEKRIQARFASSG